MITDFWRTMGGAGLYPWGPFDPDDSLNFSFDASDFLAAAGTALTLQGMTMTLDPKLVAAGKLVAGNVVTWRIERDPNVTASAGDIMKMVIRTTSSDGQHADKTFYLVLQDS